MKNASILLIYTGGTIGMKTDPRTGALVPFDFNDIYDEFPYLRKLNVDIEVITLKPIDSSNVTPELWVKLARMLRDNYRAFDGFVILHGTDTMSYTASALSFMLGNLGKPVVFTGSQIPIGVLRTDGRENLITAIEIAAAKRDGAAVVPEVCLYFQNRLFRANRTTKHSAEQLNAFRSDNYPPLAEVGVSIHYNTPFIRRPERPAQTLEIATTLDTGVLILKIFPGLTESAFRAMLSILRGRKRAHGRVVHPRRGRSDRTGRSSDERHPVSRRKRLDGFVRNRAPPAGDRRGERPRHHHRSRRHQTDGRAGRPAFPGRALGTPKKFPAGRN